MANIKVTAKTAGRNLKRWLLIAFSRVALVAEKTKHFIAPLGVGDLLISWGIEAAKVQQFDWWESTVIDSIRFVSTPAQHFSGRSLRDEDKTLPAKRLPSCTVLYPLIEN